MTDPSSDNLSVGVIGAGAMGQGIIQVALAGGCEVVIHDAVAGSAEKGLASVRQRLERLAEKGQMTAGEASAALGRARIVDSLAGMKDCHVVIEAVFEDLALKQEIFVELESVVGPDCVLASNTSSLLIAAIGRKCAARDRIAGMHFFNPVPLMKLVEIVRGPDSSDETLAFLTGLAKRMGRVPVTVKDAPGFLVNLGGRAYTTEAMRLLHERVATPAQIDAVMRDCCGFRMGPLELADLTGVDVNYPVSQFIFEGYNHDPRLKTSFPHRALMEAGRLGRKAGRGSYAYGEGGAMSAGGEADYKTDAGPAKRIHVCDGSDELAVLLRGLGCEVLDKDDGAAPLAAALLGEDCSSFAARTGADHRRLVGVDISCDVTKRITVITAPGADAACLDAVAALLARDGRKVTSVKDSPGFIAQRMRAMIANLGCEMAQIGIAAPEEIDLAMKLGLNYPLGPLELAERMGARETLTVMRQLHAITGDDRYRPSLWLKRRAELNLPIHTPD